MESKLITGNSWFGGMQKESGPMTFDKFRQTLIRRLRERFKIPETGFDDKSFTVKAFVNHGNWLVICPQCGGAEYAWEEGWFFCCSCKNSYMGHKYRRLEFPKERELIEELLIIRPLNNRNWTPKESMEDLERENEEHAAELLVRSEGR